jgi:hypothetical protein
VLYVWSPVRTFRAVPEGTPVLSGPGLPPDDAGTVEVAVVGGDDGVVEWVGEGGGVLDVGGVVGCVLCVAGVVGVGSGPE